MQVLMRAPETIIVTRHAIKLARQRLGLKRSAVPRTAERAWRAGAVSTSVGRSHVDPAAIMLRWLDHVFVFRRQDGVVKLISVIPATPKLEPDEDRDQRIARLASRGRRPSYQWRR